MRSAIRTRQRLAALCLLSTIIVTPARAVIEEQYNQDTAGVPETTWFIAADPAALAADREYVSGMRPHHAGALTMSRDYLADPQSSSPVLRSLAQAIIRNQTFEIALLDGVAANLQQPPIIVPLGFTTLRLQPVAHEGLAQKLRFLRSPIPSRLDGLSNPAARVTARDVAFAKGMIMHHQAAVDMARAYHANRAARNGFLGLMNIDIERDQTQEIGLMQSVIRQYRGNPDDIIVDPATIAGMEGMHHGEGHGGGAAAPVNTSTAGSQSAQRPQPLVPPAAPGHEGHHH
jgi:uncharacterized protein (DUF305 family)